MAYAFSMHRTPVAPAHSADSYSQQCVRLAVAALGNAEMRLAAELLAAAESIDTRDWIAVGAALLSIHAPLQQWFAWIGRIDSASRVSRTCALAWLSQAIYAGAAVAVAPLCAACGSRHETPCVICSTPHPVSMAHDSPANDLALSSMLHAALVPPAPAAPLRRRSHSPVKHRVSFVAPARPASPPSAQFATMDPPPPFNEDSFSLSQFARDTEPWPAPTPGDDERTRAEWGHSSCPTSPRAHPMTMECPPSVPASQALADPSLTPDAETDSAVQPQDADESTGESDAGESSDHDLLDTQMPVECMDEGQIQFELSQAAALSQPAVVRAAAGVSFDGSVWTFQRVPRAPLFADLMTPPACDLYRPPPGVSTDAGTTVGVFLHQLRFYGSLVFPNAPEDTWTDEKITAWFRTPTLPLLLLSMCHQEYNCDEDSIRRDLASSEPCDFTRAAVARAFRYALGVIVTTEEAPPCSAQVELRSGRLVATYRCTRAGCRTTAANTLGRLAEHADAPSVAGWMDPVRAHWATFPLPLWSKPMLFAPFLLGSATRSLILVSPRMRTSDHSDARLPRTAYHPPMDVVVRVPSRAPHAPPPPTRPRAATRHVAPRLAPGSPLARLVLHGLFRPRQ